MADKTKIEWTEATWNPITGCSVTSPGCASCYAMLLAGTRLAGHPSRAGLTRDTKAGPVWTGEVRLNEGWLAQPLKWKRPRMIFVCAHADLFHENVPDAWIDRVFAVMALAPQHTFQVLTKRSPRMRAYMNDPATRDRIDAVMDEIAPAHWHTRELEDFGSWPLPHVWLGVSTEDQRRADERVPDLLATPAAVRWVSAEPLIEAVDFERITVRVPGEPGGFHHYVNALTGGVYDDENGTIDGAYGDAPSPRLAWVVVGGESGRGARAMHPQWARDIRDQCDRSGTAFFFKQWGLIAPLAGALPVNLAPPPGSLVAWPDGTVGGGSAAENGGEGVALFRAAKSLVGRLLDGVDHSAMPGPV
mgnify:CR=1 FL=1|jgi:protein gp37